jgi:hypothetical protein
MVTICPPLSVLEVHVQEIWMDTKCSVCLTSAVHFFYVYNLLILDLAILYANVHFCFNKVFLKTIL